MNWILLILAGCLELVFTFCLGKINRVIGVEKYLWSLGVADIFMCQYASPDKSNKGIARWHKHAIWTGIGAAGTVLIGIFFFKEPARLEQNVLYLHIDLLHRWFEIGITLIPYGIIKK